MEWFSFLQKINMYGRVPLLKMPDKWGVWTVHRLGGGDIHIVLGTIVLGSNTFCFLMSVIMFVAKKGYISSGKWWFLETFNTNYEAKFKVLGRIGLCNRFSFWIKYKYQVKWLKRAQFSKPLELPLLSQTHQHTCTTCLLPKPKTFLLPLQQKSALTMAVTCHTHQMYVLHGS